MKPPIFRMLYRFGVFDVLRHLQGRRRLSILIYHRFSHDMEPFTVRQATFARQLEYICSRYQVVSLSDLVEYLSRRSRRLPSNPLLITIDDGYADNYTYAYPVLKEFGIPAVIFLATDFINDRQWLWSNKLEYILKHSPRKAFTFPLGSAELAFDVSNFGAWHQAQLTIFDHCTSISDTGKDQLLGDLADHLGVKVPDRSDHGFEPLSWGQIREMQQHGIEFGSHSCSHPILSRVDASRLPHELVDSKKQIEERLGCPVQAFCYPNGRDIDISDEVVGAVQQAGYACAVTTNSGFNSPRSDPYRLKRLSLTTDDQIKILRYLTAYH